jgi:hypothetical protein
VKSTANPEDPRAGILNDDGCRYVGVYFAVVACSLVLAALGAWIHGIPVPVVHDEFSYLFAGETFARLRLANPVPPSPESFFSPHILVEPTFSSNYPPAQGLFLAIGSVLGLPIAGIWLSGALAAGAMLWCARAILPLQYALAAVLLFMVSVLFTGVWIATYWGGLVPFLGGALVVGFFLRLQYGLPNRAAAAALGAGLATLALSRPFEGLVLCVALGLIFSGQLAEAIRSAPTRQSLERGLISGALVAGALIFQLTLNSAVTGSPLRMPHAEFQAQYLAIPLFRWQSPTFPRHSDPRLMAVEQNFDIRDSWPAHLTVTFGSVARAVSDLGGVLLVGSLLTGLTVSVRRHPRLVAVLLLVPLLQSAANYVHLPHYFAPVAPLWFLMGGVAAAAVFDRWRVPPRTLLLVGVLVSVASIAHRWLGEHPVRQHSMHDLVRGQMARFAPALVFVTYDPSLSVHTNVVYNDPDLANDVLLVNDLDQERNCEVVRSFPGRRVIGLTISRSGLTADGGPRCGPDVRPPGSIPSR